jgi:hypothetical protein
MNVTRAVAPLTRVVACRCDEASRVRVQNTDKNTTPQTSQSQKQSHHLLDKKIFLSFLSSASVKPFPFFQHSHYIKSNTKEITNESQKITALQSHDLLFLSFSSSASVKPCVTDEWNARMVLMPTDVKPVMCIKSVVH